MFADLINQTLPKYDYESYLPIPDKRTVDWPLINSPWPLITITATYVYFVKVWGPNWMKDRKPFKIEPIIVTYNAIMVILSAYFFAEGNRLTYFSGKYNLKCQPVDQSETGEAAQLTILSWWFLIMKIVEFSDTIFFVLKKNNRQISNLHVFHHSSVVLGSLIGIRYVPGGHGMLFPIMNCFVHVIMYTYYLLSAMGPNVRKHLWWKKYLTQFQMSQFIIAGMHNILPLYYDCGYPKIFSLMSVTLALIFLTMFANFYLKNYLKQTNHVKQEISLKQE